MRLRDNWPDTRLSGPPKRKIGGAFDYNLASGYSKHLVARGEADEQVPSNLGGIR